MRSPVFKRTAELLLVLMTGVQVIFATPQAKGFRPEAQVNGEAQSGGVEEINQLNDSVVKLYSRGKFKEALPLASRALELAEKTFGAEHRDLAPLLANLAELHIGLKQYADAEPFARRSLAILEKTFGPDHPNLNKAIDRLARLRHLAGNDQEAEALYRRAVSISERAFGTEDIKVAEALERLAMFYGERLESEKSNDALDRLVTIVEKAPDSMLSGIEETIARYGCLRNKIKQATNLYAGQPPNDEPFNGKAIKLGRPKFPVEAKLSGAHGRVHVRVLIDEEGKVIQACAMSGPKVFKEAVEEAALQSRFTPTMVKGKLFKVKGLITFTFVARDR